MQNGNPEQEVIDLSKEKWRWMSERNVDSLDALFHEKAVFVHMGGSWGKEREIDIIKSGGIHYKQADNHEVSVKIIGATKPHHLDDALAAISVKLTADEIARLEEPYRPHPVIGHS